MSKIPRLSIIIVSYNTKILLEACLGSVVKYTKGIDYEIIVVDNASSDNSLDELSKFEIKNFKLKLIHNRSNLGFAVANNQGAKIAKGQYILLLNSDTELTANILPEMLDWMDEHKKTGIVTCMLKYPDARVQATGGYFPTLLRVISWMTIQDIPGVDKLIKPFHPMKDKSWRKAEDFYSREKELDWVTGAFLLMSKKTFEDVGPIDEDYFMYTEEVDYCYRAKALGWQVWYLPRWSIIHVGGASSTTENAVLKEFEGIKLFYKKHYPAWQYPLLKFFLKLGALIRIPILGILEGPKAAKTYAKAFIRA